MSQPAPRAYQLPAGDRLEERPLPPLANLSQIVVEGRVCLVEGGTIEPRTFVLRDASGTEKATYGPPIPCSLDDALFLSPVYFVRDGTLLSATLKWNVRRDGARCRLLAPRVELAELVLER